MSHRRTLQKLPEMCQPELKSYKGQCGTVRMSWSNHPFKATEIMFANNKKVHLSALLLIWTCLMHANISIALKERWFTKQVYPGFLLSLKHCFKKTGITKLHTARSFQTTSRISFITPTVTVASSQRTQSERHVTTGFEMTWIKCDSLIQGHLKLFQASCRVKTDSNGPHMAEVSFDLRKNHTKAWQSACEWATSCFSP